jgi:hypothetical protein
MLSIQGLEDKNKMNNSILQLFKLSWVRQRYTCLKGTRK